MRVVRRTRVSPPHAEADGVTDILLEQPCQRRAAAGREPSGLGMMIFWPVSHGVEECSGTPVVLPAPGGAWTALFD